jgi:hypothetical protein
MGGGGSGSSNNTTTVYQNADPWSQQQGYLKDIFQQSQNAYNSGQLAPPYYPGNTLAPMSDATSQALALQEQRALNGNAGMTAAQNQLAQTMSGEYLQNNPFMNSDGNPQLDSMVQRAIGQTNAGVAGNFAQAGRYGSGAFNAAANDAAGNVATQMYGEAYDNDMNRMLSAWNTERDNQIKGMLFAPQLAAADYQDIAALSEVGTARENYQQDQINADMDRYNYEQGRESLALQNYLNLISGNFGSQGSSTTEGGSSANSNPLGGILGGALGGGGLGLMLGGSSGYGLLGSLLGGATGGLLNLF